MAKIAIISIGLHGHVNPTLGITEELIQRGHEVVHLTSTPFATKVLDAGARFRSFGDALTATMGQMATLSTPDMASQRFTAYRVETQKAGEEMKRALDAEVPDLILYDFILPDAALLAKQMNVPAVKFFTTYALNDGFDLLQAFSNGTDFFGDSEAKEFLAGLKVSASSNLVFLPKAFQPFAETFDSSFHFVGPCLRRRETGGLEVEALRPEKPLIIISLGTIFHERPEFYKMCVDIFADRDVQIVMAVGSDAAAQALGKLPEHIVAMSHIPQVKLLAKATLFISHGGMNSTMESLSFGVPLVVIPQMTEQAITAQRVSALGLGIHIDPAMLTRDLLESAVDKILVDDTFRKNALNMRSEIIKAGGTQRAVSILENELRL